MVLKQNEDTRPAGEEDAGLIHVGVQSPLSLSREQIQGLSPDRTIYQGSKGLALPENWQLLNRSSSAAWGEFSNRKRPSFRTRIALPGPAVSCTCMGSKIPCRHSLALLQLLANHPGSFNQARQPDWAEKWRMGPANGLIEQVNQQENEDRRQANIVAGMAELERWLRDMVRSGVATLPGKPKRYWIDMANRLMDAQAGEVAFDLNRMATIPGSRPDWPDEILARLGRLYMLTQGFSRFETLPTSTQFDLRAAVGWMQKPGSREAGDRLEDEWLVLGRRLVGTGKRAMQRTWLWGLRHDKPALLTKVFHGNKNLHLFLPTGIILPAQLFFPSSNWPLRAQLLARPAPAEGRDGTIGYPTITQATRQYAQAQSANPWLRAFPMALKAVLPVFDGTIWRIRDEIGTLLPLPAIFNYGWHLMAISGGRPLSLFGEWEGATFFPLSVKSGERWIDLHVLRGIK